MKGYSKVISFAAVVAFAVVATMPVLANNDKSQGNEHRSKRATDVQIHPRIQLKGADAERFKKIKKHDEELAVKGKPTKSQKPPKNEEPTSSIAATGVIGEDLEEGAQKYAIVIGICDYPAGLEYGDICESDGDAKYMYHALTTEYGFLPENISLFRDMIADTEGEMQSQGATYDGIKSAIDHLRDDGIVTSKDEVVFFFSGHGVTGLYDDGDGEVRKNNPDEAILVHNGVDQYEYIWDGELRDWFTNFPTDRITFIFDTCKAEGMNDVMENSSTDENGVGRVFIAATTEKGNAHVYSGGADGEGVFSHYFVKNGIRGYNGAGGGWADGYNQLGWDSRTQDGWTTYVDDDGKIIGGELVSPPVIGQDGFVVMEEAYEYAKEKTAAWYSDQEVVVEDLFTNDLLLGYYLQ